MWEMGRDGSGWVGNVFGNDFGLGNKLKSRFWIPELDFSIRDPGNTGTPDILINQ